MWALIVFIYEGLSTRIYAIKFATVEHCETARAFLESPPAITGFAFCVELVEKIAV